MSKAVLLSIRPEWCKKILDGEKTVELRRTCPVHGTPFKVYIYCTLAASKAFVLDDRNWDVSAGSCRWPDKRGCVIGEFICKKMTGLRSIMFSRGRTRTMEIDISGAVQGFVQDIEKQVASRAERAAHVIRKHELSVLSNNPKRSGKVYRKPASNKTYTASAPGEPPALRTGDLRRSFRPLAKSEIVQSAKHYTPGIRTDVKYAPFLEDGTSKISPRPYAEEIKQKAFPEVKAIFEEKYT